MTREQHEAARRAWWTRQFERGHSLSVAARIKEADEALAGYDKAFPAPVEREPDEATAAQLDEALALIADLVTGARTIDQAREWLDDHHFSSPVAVRVDPKPEPEWRPHTPGDPMPCERTAFVDVQLDDGTVIRDHQAVCFYWEGSATGNIIAWRPAQ